jgi:hypothetical protein
VIRELKSEKITGYTNRSVSKDNSIGYLIGAKARLIKWIVKEG